MPLLPLADRAIRYDTTGSGTPVILAHPLGYSAAIWAQVVPHLAGHRIVTYDLRGAGMGALVRDAEALMDALDLREAVFVGAGLGGLVAQGLAVKRLDLVRAMVLVNSAARIPATAAWRAKQTAATDMAPLVDRIIARSFSPAARRSGAARTARRMLLDCDPATYAAGAAAVEGTDFYTPTAALRLPTLVVAGGADGITPADLVRETADLVPGADFRLLQGTGHLPMLENPEALAALLGEFMARIGH